MRVFQVEFNHLGKLQVEFVKAARLGLRGRLFDLVRIIEVKGGN